MRTTWAFTAFVLLMVLVGVAIGNLVLRIRRMTYREPRGFEVITKPESGELPEARKD